MRQELIEIGEVLVPVIINDDVKWYPMTYISDKVLLRKGGMTGKQVREKYRDYIKKLEIDFTFIDYNAGSQISNCITSEGLNNFLLNSKIGRLDIEQRKAQNKLLQHLGMSQITEREYLKNEITDNEIDEHDQYVKDIIVETMKLSEISSFQLCNKCDRYYPLDSNFFPPNNRDRETGYTTLCHRCLDDRKGFKHPNVDIEKAVKQVGEDIFVAFKENKLITIYEKYLKGELKHLPDCYQNRDDYLKIIKWLYDEGEVTKENISTRLLIKEYKLKKLVNLLSIHEIYTYVIGENYYFYPWKYPNMRFTGELSLTYEVANVIAKNYIDEFLVNDPLMIDYELLISKSRLTKVLDYGCTLSFAVQFNEFKYPGYKFKTKSSNYYKNDENLKFDLKYFIEKDMEIPIDKIPLYLTRNTLQKNCRPLYHVIVTQKNRSIYEWINEMYPNKYIEADFEINAYRNEFDSDTEAFIDDIMRESLKSVLYNQRNTDRTITLNGCQPDWLVFTDSGVWIVEYLGMYIPGKTDSRSLEYIRKTESKFRKYEDIKGYNILYLYPEDIENNFQGVREKIKQIK